MLFSVLSEMCNELTFCGANSNNLLEWGDCCGGAKSRIYADGLRLWGGAGPVNRAKGRTR